MSTPHQTPQQRIRAAKDDIGYYNVRIEELEYDLSAARKARRLARARLERAERAAQGVSCG